VASVDGSFKTSQSTSHLCYQTITYKVIQTEAVGV